MQKEFDAKKTRLKAKQKAINQRRLEGTETTRPIKLSLDHFHS